MHQATKQSDQLYLLRITSAEIIQVVNHHSGERRRFTTLTAAFTYITQAIAPTDQTNQTDRPTHSSDLSN